LQTMTLRSRYITELHSGKITEKSEVKQVIKQCSHQSIV
jgi:hypothetical protein